MEYVSNREYAIYLLTAVVTTKKYLAHSNILSLPNQKGITGEYYSFSSYIQYLLKSRNMFCLSRTVFGGRKFFLVKLC